MTHSNEKFSVLKQAIMMIQADTSRDYIRYAFKKIVEQQLLFVTVPEPSRGFFPILKLLDDIIREIEELMFLSGESVADHEELKEFILWFFHPDQNADNVDVSNGVC